MGAGKVSFFVLFCLRVGSLGIAYVTTTPQDRRTKNKGLGRCPDETAPLTTYPGPASPYLAQTQLWLLLCLDQRMHRSVQTQAPLPFTRIGFWARCIVSSSLTVVGTHVINRRGTPSVYDEGLLLRTPLNKDLPLCIGCSIGAWPF